VRSKQEVSHALFKFKQALTLSGIKPEPNGLGAMAAEIIGARVRGMMEQILEGWSLADAMSFLKAIELETEKPGKKQREVVQ